MRHLVVLVFSVLVATGYAHPPGKEDKHDGGPPAGTRGTATAALKKAGCPDEFFPPKFKAEYYRDIAPLIEQQCVGCHRPGGPAAEYGDFRTPEGVARSRHAILREIVEGRMPHGATTIPDPKCGGADRFKGLRHCSSNEVCAFANWIDTKMDIGRRPERGGPPQPDSGNGALSAVPPPEVVFSQVPGGFKVTPSAKTNGDQFRNFLVDVKDASDVERFLVGFDVKPGKEGGEEDRLKTRVVHHVHLFVVPPSQVAKAQAWDRKWHESLAKDSPLRGAGVEARLFPPEDFQAELVGTWFPGSQQVTFPPGMGHRIPKGSKLFVQMHYTNYGNEDVVDETQLGLRFARQPIESAREELTLNYMPPECRTPNPPASIICKVPAGAKEFKISKEMVIPKDVDLSAFLTHSHQIATYQKIEIRKPGGEWECLITKHWDFDHQNYDELMKPMRLPKGTQVRMTCTYDNTAGNPRQFQPKDKIADVKVGPAAENEMCRTDFVVTDPTARLAVSKPAADADSAGIDADGNLAVRVRGLLPGARLEVNGRVLVGSRVEADRICSSEWRRGLKSPGDRSPLKVAVINPDGGRTETLDVKH